MWERPWCRECRDAEVLPTLGGIVENPAAVFAADNFFARSGTHGGGGSHLHVAARANFVFQWDDDRVTFAGEKTLEESEQIFIDLFGQSDSVVGELGEACLERL